MIRANLVDFAIGATMVVLVRAVIAKFVLWVVL